MSDIDICCGKVTLLTPRYSSPFEMEKYTGNRKGKILPPWLKEEIGK